MTTSILDVPEIRASVHRWTVADFRTLAEDQPGFEHSELIRGVIVEKKWEKRGQASFRLAFCLPNRTG